MEARQANLVQITTCNSRNELQALLDITVFFFKMAVPF